LYKNEIVMFDDISNIVENMLCFTILTWL